MDDEDNENGLVDTWSLWEEAYYKEAALESSLNQINNPNTTLDGLEENREESFYSAYSHESSGTGNSGSKSKSVTEDSGNDVHESSEDSPKIPNQNGSKDSEDQEIDSEYGVEGPVNRAIVVSTEEEAIESHSVNQPIVSPCPKNHTPENSSNTSVTDVDHCKSPCDFNPVERTNGPESLPNDVIEKSPEKCHPSVTDDSSLNSTNDECTNSASAVICESTLTNLSTSPKSHHATSTCDSESSKSNDSEPMEVADPVSLSISAGESKLPAECEKLTITDSELLIPPKVPPKQLSSAVSISQDDEPREQDDSPDEKQPSTSFDSQLNTAHEAEPCTNLSEQESSIPEVQHAIKIEAQSPKSSVQPSTSSQSSLNSEAQPPDFSYTRKVYKCEACDIYFENWNLFLHMREVHKRHLCLFCLGMFGEAERLAHHLAKNHSIPDVAFESIEDFYAAFKGSCYVVCCSCDRIFSETDNFSDHFCPIRPNHSSATLYQVGKQTNAPVTPKSELLNFPSHHTSETMNSARRHSKRTIKPVGLNDDMYLYTQLTRRTKQQQSPGVSVASKSVHFDEEKDVPSVETVLENENFFGDSVDRTIMEVSRALDYQDYDLSEQSTFNTHQNEIPQNVAHKSLNGARSISIDDSSSFVGASPCQGGTNDVNNHGTSVDKMRRLSLQHGLHTASLESSDPKSEDNVRLNNGDVSHDMQGHYLSQQNLPNNSAQDPNYDHANQTFNHASKFSSHFSPHSAYGSDGGVRQNTEYVVKSVPKSKTIPGHATNPPTSDRSLVIKICTKNKSMYSISKPPSFDGEEYENSSRSGDSDDDNKSELSDEGASVPEKMEQNDITVGLQNSDSDSDRLEVIDNPPDENAHIADPSESVDERKHFQETMDANQQPFQASGEQTDSSHRSQPVAALHKTENNDGIILAGEDIPLIDLDVDDLLENIQIEDILRKCIQTAYSTCVYCNHARQIAVNGKQLSLHMLAEHRFQPQHAAIVIHQDQLTRKMKDCLEDLGTFYMNLDSFDSKRGTYDISPLRIYECFHCRFYSSAHKDLYLHNRKMHQKPILICIMCKSTFYNYSELLCHLCPGVYAVESEILYRCCLCSSSNLPSAFRLMVHLRKHHHACDVCLETTDNQQRLSNHIWKHKLHHFCYRCGIAYRNKPDITKHLFWKHGTESVLCKKCLQKKWPHIYHFCIPPTAFICEECGFSFTRAVSLKVHKRIHINEYPYSCSECPEKLVSKKLLAKHEQSHREPPKVPTPPPGPAPSFEANVNPSETDTEDIHIDVCNPDSKSDEVTEVAPKLNSPEPVKKKVDVYDLPPLNLSSDSDSDDEAEVETAIKTRDEKVDDIVIDSGIAAETESVAEIATKSVVEEGVAAVPEPTTKDETETEGPPDKESDSKSCSSGKGLDDTAKLSDQESQNTTKPDSVEVEKEEEDKNREEQIMDGIWNNFKSYAASLEKTDATAETTPTEDSTSKSDVNDSQSERHPDLEVLKGIVLADHDYCVIYSDKINPSSSPTNAAASASGEIAQPRAERTPSPKCTEVVETESSKKKPKTPKKKKQNSNSSSSDSSSDSDSSSCSCGTNCSCSSSSSSGSSSSSSSSDSDSSASESSPTKANKEKRKKEKDPVNSQEQIDVVEEVAQEPIMKNDESPMIEPVPEVVAPPPKLVIMESDLDTTESETDEEFYDEHPQRAASKLLAEKRRLLLAAAGAPEPTDSSLSTSVNNGMISTDTAAQSHDASSIPINSIGMSRKRKLKTKKRKRGARSGVRKSVKLIDPSKPYVPKSINQRRGRGSKTSVPRRQSTSHQTPNQIYNNSGYGKNDGLYTDSTLNYGTPQNFAGSESDTDPKRSSKRVRVPKRFYGDSSDEENHRHLMAKWRRVDLPSQENFQSPLTSKIQSFGQSQHLLQNHQQQLLQQQQLQYQHYQQQQGYHAQQQQYQVPQEQHFHHQNLQNQNHYMDTSRDADRGIANAASQSDSDKGNDTSSDSSDSDTEKKPSIALAQTPSYYNTQLHPPNRERPNNLYCYCQCPYDEVSEMIACDGDDCRIEWFHFECVGITVPPKGKWYCPDCRRKLGIPDDMEDLANNRVQPSLIG